ncbi:MAG: hypothetical protein ABSB75_06130 [Candidatus Limnocylindrales bacterium]
MRWLVLLGAAGAVAFGLWWLAKGRPDRPGSPGRPARSPTLAEFAFAVLSLVLLAAAVYAALWLGIYSLPLVAAAFVPFGLAVRWLLLATRGSRQIRDVDGSAAAGGWWARLALPLLVVMVAAIAVLGVVVGALVGRH